jgi:hypothetical protein
MLAINWRVRNGSGDSGHCKSCCWQRCCSLEWQLLHRSDRCEEMLRLDGQCPSGCCKKWLVGRFGLQQHLHPILWKYNNLITQPKLLTHRYKHIHFYLTHDHTHHTRFNQLHFATICILSHQLRNIPFAHTFTSTHSMCCKTYCYAGSSHALLFSNHLSQDYLATTIAIGYLQKTSSRNTMFWNL